MAVSQRPTETTPARTTTLTPHASGARLSVVLLSTGSLQELETAVSVLANRLYRFGAQLVVVRADGDLSELEALVEYPFVTFVSAPAGASRPQLCDLGMTRASGDIVALRETRSVRDGSWLDSFSTAVTAGETSSDRLVADWAKVGYAETSRADAAPAPTRPSERTFPGDLTGPADVSLAPIPLA